MSSAKNYVGQLRLYSYSDLVLMLLATGADARALAQASCLWLGFLVFLEYIHRDRGRHRWPLLAWVAPWLAAVLLNPSYLLIAFGLLAVLYTLKKTVPPLASVSPILNGCLKGSLVCLVPGVAVWQVTVVVILTALRNLAGDFRDVAKDSAEKGATLPVRLGMHRDITWIYPATLAATSTVWVIIGGLPAWALLTAFLVQATTYRWTPR